MPGDTYEAESNSELGSGLLCNLKRCSGYSYIIRDRMLCVRGSQGQVMLPLSSYDSSLDLTETFPISPHLSVSLLPVLFLISPRTTPTHPPADVNYIMSSVYSLCSDSIPPLFSRCHNALYA